MTTSGPMKFGDEPTGVFITNKDALHLMVDVDTGYVREVLALLASADKERRPDEHTHVRKMKPYGEALAEQPPVSTEAPDPQPEIEMWHAVAAGKTHVRSRYKLGDESRLARITGCGVRFGTTARKAEDQSAPTCGRCRNQHGFSHDVPMNVGELWIVGKVGKSHQIAKVLDAPGHKPWGLSVCGHRIEGASAWKVEGKEPMCWECRKKLGLPNDLEAQRPLVREGDVWTSASGTKTHLVNTSAKTGSSGWAVCGVRVNPRYRNVKKVDGPPTCLSCRKGSKKAPETPTPTPGVVEIWHATYPGKTHACTWHKTTNETFLSGISRCGLHLDVNKGARKADDQSSPTCLLCTRKFNTPFLIRYQVTTSFQVGDRTHIPGEIIYTGSSQWAENNVRYHNAIQRGWLVVDKT